MGGLVIVTGGSRGIGAAISRRLARDGYAVAVNYAARPEAAAGVVQEITAAGGQAEAFGGDVSREADVERLFAAAQDRFGRLHGLVNNAGITGGMARLDELTLDVLNHTLAVNVVGTMLASRAAVRAMSARHGGAGGTIVNLSSTAARLGAPGEYVHYAASKGAIDTITVGLGREVAGEGIRVNAVAPGLIDTEMNSGERQARLAPTVPAKRVGMASEIAEAVAWLFSPGASYVMGTVLTVGGGR